MMCICFRIHCDVANVYSDIPVSENGICLTQQICDVMILFHKRLNNKNMKVIKV